MVLKNCSCTDERLSVIQSSRPHADVFDSSGWCAPITDRRNRSKEGIERPRTGGPRRTSRRTRFSSSRNTSLTETLACSMLGVLDIIRFFLRGHAQDLLSSHEGGWRPRRDALCFCPQAMPKTDARQSAASQPIRRRTFRSAGPARPSRSF